MDSPCMLLSGGSFSFIYQTTNCTVPRGMICILLNSQWRVQILHPPLSFVPVKLLPFHSRTLNLPPLGSCLLAFWLNAFTLTQKLHTYALQISRYRAVSSSIITLNLGSKECSIPERINFMPCINRYNIWHWSKLKILWK